MAEQAKVGFSPSTGQHFVKLPGNVTREVTAEQAALIQSDPGAISNILGSAYETGKNLLLGGASLLAPGAEDRQMAQQALVPGQQQMQAREMVGPVSAFTGSALPQVAADVAGFALGGVPGAIAAGALTGAAGSPDAPIEGAAIGGAFGALPAAAPAFQAGRRMVDRVTGRIAQAESQMVDANATAFQQGQRLKGLYSPEEAQAMNLPLTAGDRAMLSAGDEAGANTARRMRRMEETRRTDPVFGADIEQTRQAQKGWLTARVKNELDITGPETFTPATIGAQLEKQGAQFDAVGRTIGRVDAYDVIPGMERALADATGSHAQQLKSVLEKADQMLSKGAGSLDGAELMNLRSDLNRIVKAGQGQGDYAKAYDATQMIKAIDDVISRNITGPEKAAYDKLRRQYSITKKLMRPGAVNAEGVINPTSFKNALLGSRNTSFKAAGGDDILRAATTASMLDQRVVGSSGTAERLLANPGRTALRVGGGAALGAAGIGGAGQFLQ